MGMRTRRRKLLREFRVRWSGGTCPRCHLPVLAGQRVVQQGTGPRAHTGCVVVRAADATRRL